MKSIFNVTIEHNTFNVLPGETILEGAVEHVGQKSLKERQNSLQLKESA